MTRTFFSARAFSLTFGLGYAVAVFFDLPLFRYHPLINGFTFGPMIERPPGPSMSWFGWIATGAVIGLVLTAILPKRIGDRIPLGAFYVLVGIMIAAALQHEARNFLPVA